MNAKTENEVAPQATQGMMGPGGQGRVAINVNDLTQIIGDKEVRLKVLSDQLAQAQQENNRLRQEIASLRKMAEEKTGGKVKPIHGKKRKKGKQQKQNPADNVGGPRDT